MRALCRGHNTLAAVTQVTSSTVLPVGAKGGKVHGEVLQEKEMIQELVKTTCHPPQTVTTIQDA